MCLFLYTPSLNQDFYDQIQKITSLPSATALNLAKVCNEKTHQQWLIQAYKGGSTHPVFKLIVLTMCVVFASNIVPLLFTAKW